MIMGSTVCGRLLCRPFLDDPLLNARLMVVLGYGRLLGPRQFGVSMRASPDKYFSFDPFPVHFSPKFGHSDCAVEQKMPSRRLNVAMSCKLMMTSLDKSIFSSLQEENERVSEQSKFQFLKVIKSKFNQT